MHGSKRIAEGIVVRDTRSLDGNVYKIYIESPPFTTQLVPAHKYFTVSMIFSIIRRLSS
jgi:hypothetical protein